MDAYMSWNVNYSFERPVERDMMHKVRAWMTELEEREKKEQKPEPEGFYFTGVPEFDKKTWEKMLKNLEGLS